MRLRRRIAPAAIALMLLAGCSSTTKSAPTWVEDDVTFVADGLTLHGTYRHRGDTAGPAALLISESGRTDRNGDNNVAGPIGNMRQLAEYLSEHGVASLRYDKVGTGTTGLGPYAANPADVGSAVYTGGAKAAVRFCRPARHRQEPDLGLRAGEGTIHAMSLADDTASGAPRIHSLGLLQPLAGRYLDLITGRVKADVAAAVKAGQKNQQQADQVVAAWTAAVTQARTSGTVPGQAARGAVRNRQSRQRQGRRRGRRDRPAGSGGPHPGRHPGVVDVLGLRRPGQLRRYAAAGRRAGAQWRCSTWRLKGVNHVLRDDRPTTSPTMPRTIRCHRS